MILTLDIGNTNIKTALFDGTEMKKYWRISTNRMMSSDRTLPMASSMNRSIRSTSSDR